MSGADKFKFISPSIKFAEIDNTALPTIGEGQGPAIIGRASRGPVMTPIKVRSQKEFVEIFGEPVAGTSSGDVFREGDVLSPMYGAYAAYAYLKNQSPLTFVRLAGWEHPTRTDDFGEAGWKTTYTEMEPLAAGSKNGGAYGLFIMDKYPQTAGSTTFSGTGTTTATITLVGTNGTTAFADGVVVKIDAAGAPDTYTYSFDGGTTWDAGGNNVTTGAPIQLGSSNFYIEFSATTGADLDDQWTLDLAHGDMVYAAKFYCNDGALALKGDLIGGTTPTDGTAAAALVDSVGSNYEFDMKIFDSTWNNAGTEDTDAELETIRFNFNRSSSRYIRKVFNTNPTLVNSDITTSSNLKSYFLGETYDQFLLDSLSGTTGSGSQVAVLLKIEDDGAVTGSGSDFRYEAQPAESGWVFSQDLSGDYSLYDADNMQKLFKIYTRGDHGRDIKVSFDNIRYSSFESDPYGRFDVIVRDASDTDKKMKVLERFSACTLNPSDPSYVARQIGNRYVSWDSDALRYRSYGKYINKSKFIRLEMDQDVEAGAHNQSCVPWGYYGKPAYANISIDTTGSNVVAFSSNDFVRGGDTTTTSLPFATSLAADGKIDDDDVQILTTLKDAVVKLRDDSTDGNIINYKRSFWGVYTNRNSADKFDESYYDLVRAKSIMGNGKAGSASGMKYSHKFTLDDIRFYNAGVSGIQNRATYASGNRVAGTSITAGEEYDGTTVSPAYTLLCDAGFARFTVELYGGSLGLDITEKDFVRNERISDNGSSEILNYTAYTLNSALNIVRDPDFVEYNLLAIPGITNGGVNNKIIDICEDRADAFGVIDTEGQYTPSHENNSSEETRVGSVSGAITSHLSNGIDSSYASTFFNWVQIVDGNNNNALLYMPPSVAAIDNFAASEKQSEVWFAAAGYTRGNLTDGRTGLNYVDVLFNLNEDDRDDLYEANINAIAARPEGILVWGNKTLLQSTSALSRINVRRLMIYIKKEIANMASTVLFEPNIYATWNKFTSKVEPFLGGVKVGGGLEAFQVVLDENTTTPDLVDRNIIYGIIKIIPAKAVEYIGVDFVLQRSGVGFDD